MGSPCWSRLRWRCLYTMPIQWGLDLQGGVQVVLEAQDVEGIRVTGEVMERAQAVIERRVNALGVAEPIIQRQGDRRIIVELPGVQIRSRRSRPSAAPHSSSFKIPTAIPSLPARSCGAPP